jgi:hypothetical protein
MPGWVDERDRGAAQHSARLVFDTSFYASALLSKETLPDGQPHEN